MNKDENSEWKRRQDKEKGVREPINSTFAFHETLFLLLAFILNEILP